MLKKMRTLSKKWAEGEIKKFPRIRNYRILTMCEKCYAFYYKNSWHFKKPTYLSENYEEEVPVVFTQCGACLEQENALYEKESGLIFG